MPGVNITNDKALISQVINQEFKGMAGTIEYQHFIEAGNIIYCELGEADFKKGESSHEALYVWLTWLNMLLSDLWFIKDNAVICEAAFCKLTDKNQVGWTRNCLVNSTFKSSGIGCEAIDLSVDELKAWDIKSNQVQSYLHSSNSVIFNSFTNSNFSRIGRSFRFIAAASKEKHPAIKLAHYCSALESLFSTDSAELSHKLSERVALFLKTYGFNPVEVFDDIKSFYGIRSKVTHGDSLKAGREQQLPDMSQKCDNYLRVILNCLFEDEKLLLLFDGKKEVFENYFKNELLVAK